MSFSIEQPKLRRFGIGASNVRRYKHTPTENERKACELLRQIGIKGDVAFAETPFVTIHMEITPEQAKIFLKHGHKCQRPLPRSSMVKYSSDIGTNRWAWYSPEAICMSIEGDHMDGQTRLQAIVNSNKPQVMAIALGYPKEAIQFINQGKSRGIHDAIRAVIPEFTTEHRKILVSMYYGTKVRSGNKSAQEYVAFAKKHKKAVFWASKLLPANYVGSIKAVLARAYYTYNHSEIKRFANLLSHNVNTNCVGARDRAIYIQLRDILDGRDEVEKRPEPHRTPSFIRTHGDHYADVYKLISFNLDRFLKGGLVEWELRHLPIEHESLWNVNFFPLDHDDDVSPKSIKIETARKLKAKKALEKTA